MKSGPILFLFLTQIVAGFDPGHATANPAESATMQDATEEVVLEPVREDFMQRVTKLKDGTGAPWAERIDTLIYLACMHAAGWDTDYADAITITGFGPGFLYSQKHWNVHYWPPPGRDARLAHATGFGFKWERYETPAAYWEAIKAAIDAGKPVYGPYMEGVLFIGYRDGKSWEDRADVRRRGEWAHSHRRGIL